MWVFSTLTERSLGRRIEVVDALLPREAQLAAADIILLGPYGKRDRTVEVARRYRNSSVTIFVCGENTAVKKRPDFSEYFDHLADEARIVMGHRRDVGHRLPYWLPYSLTRECGCSFPAAYRGRGDAEAWMARPGFAALIARHTPFPRPELYNLMSSLGFGRVDCPSDAFHNVEWPGPHMTWPAGRPHSHLASGGKVDFLRNYRFNICPENSRTPEGGPGYNTEKAPQALEAGAVPVYWGDSPLDPEAFNPRRILAFNGSSAAIEDAVRALMTDPDARSAFFAEPVLQCGADAWLDKWCDVAADLIAVEWSKVQDLRRYQN
jgi:hypothetical protein